MIINKKEFSILIVLTGSLGDLARGLSITYYIKLFYPQSKITWLVENSLKSLVELDKNIDDIVVFNRKDKLKGFFNTIKELSKRQFDMTFDMQRILKSGIFSFFSKAPIRIGFSKKDSKEFNFIFNNHYIDHYSKNVPKIRQYLAFLKFLDINVNDEKEDLTFSYTNNIILKDEFKNILQNKKCIGLILASQWKSKDWNIKNYIELINELLEKDKTLCFVLIGTKAQKLLSDKIIQNINEKDSIIDFCGKTSLEDLLGIFKQLKFGIGPDSGAGHLFGALQVPYISLFGPTIFNRVAPYKMEHLVIQLGLSCIPCYKKKCPLSHNDCMNKITVKMVLDKIERYSLL